jgi:hypothetical protein
MFFMKYLVVAAVVLAAGCGGADANDPEQRLKSAATETARFLSGHGRFDALDLADSVDLYVAPDGGGAQARIPREQLRDPKAWRIEGGTRPITFVPTGLRTRVVTEVGRYMNCLPSDLKTRFPKLASMPHAGVRLEPPRTRSCMETWNATFVFDTTGGKTRLVAAIYDQWEW